MATKEELENIGFIDAPQPTQEQELELYRTYRQVGGGTLRLYEEMLFDTGDELPVDKYLTS